MGGAEFRLQAALTRAQFAKMLATALRVRVTESMDAPFDDLGPDDPQSLFPHEYIAALAKLGIIQGTSVGCFSPHANVSRAQMATLLVRATQVVPEAQSRLEQVLGLMEAETAVEPIRAELPGEADTLLGWQGGFAWQDHVCDPARASGSAWRVLPHGSRTGERG